MIALNNEQISEIAESLDMGMNCYLNLRSGEIKITIDDDSLIGEEKELWADYIREIEENHEDYFAFDRMNSNESFGVMADFAESIDDETIKRKLMNALNKSKPFRNFKWIIDNSGDYRE